MKLFLGFRRHLTVGCRKCHPSVTRAGSWGAFWLVLGALATSAIDPLRAAEPVGGEAALAADIPVATAPVTVDGRTLFHLRGVTAYPAEQRAAAIAERIRQVAQDTAFSVEQLRVVEAGDRSSFVVGERFVMTLVDADARLEGIERSQLARIYLAKIAEAVTAYRHDRSPRVLLINSAYVVPAAALLIAVLLGIGRAFRRLNALFEQRYKARIHGLEIQSFTVVRAQQVYSALRGLLAFCRGLAVFLALYGFLHFVLSLYPWTRGSAETLLRLVLGPVTAIATGLVDVIPNLVFIAILALITWYSLKVLKLFFAAIEQRTVRISGFDPEWAQPTYKILRLLAIIFAVVVAYPTIPGAKSPAFEGISIFLGVVFSLGSSSIIANLIAGYTLIYRREFKVGDRIQVNELLGDVSERGILVTHLRSLKNEDIVIPNSQILSSHIVNYSSLARDRGLILHTAVGIGYEVPWRQVEAMLLLAAERTPGLLREPSAFVLQKSLGDFCVTYELNVYCDQPLAMVRLYTLLHQNILDAFNEYGVQIMTPAYVCDPEVPKVVAQDVWFADPARKPTGNANT